ncbi:MAG TPA: oligosaccharide flippase family protein [Vicinamibacterales bacterium]|nr:oligosaccharide flippase family protein [Vicinamibacterales bacterium]
MRDLLRLDGVSRPALWLIVGRGVGLLAAVVVPLVIVRLFDQAAFGTYKQLFLIYGTLFGVAQLGAAETLYYFVPRSPAEAGRLASNAVVTLAVVGVACVALLGLTAAPIATWLMNPELAGTLLLLGVMLALMLLAAPFEIVLVSNQQYKAAAYTYALSEFVRAGFILVPAMVFGGLRAVLVGAIVFAAVRVLAMLWSFWRHLGATFRPSLSLWRQQCVYTLPFALAVGMEAVQGNVHHYVVASRFDPATFAIYAVGCLQIPLVDVITSSSANVMMVKMSKDGFDSRGPAALALWHDTTRRLALVIFPLAAFLLVMARDIIVVLFTSNYLASVPIFMLWTLSIVFSVPCVDALLRVHAQTRFLFGLNVLRLALVLGLTAWFLSLYGLPGAVLVTLLSTAIVRVAGMARIARLLGIGLGAVMPWTRLAMTAAYAAIAAVPTFWFSHTSSLPRVLVLISAAAIYGATYAALCYGLSRTPVRVAPALQDVAP